MKVTAIIWEHTIYYVHLGAFVHPDWAIMPLICKKAMLLIQITAYKMAKTSFWNLFKIHLALLVVLLYLVFFLFC